MAMRRPSALLVFALSAFAWIIALTLVWTKVSPWTSYPVAVLTHVALENGAPLWVRHVEKRPGHLQVETTIAVPVPDAGGRLAEIDVETDPGRYAYGLPIFMALLLAARDRHRLAKGVAGYLLLLPAQAFSATLFVLMQLVLSAQGSARILGVDAWQVEAIVYGYQLGALVVPTLVPIMLWLWLDRRFFTEVIVRGWRAGLPSGRVQPQAPAAAAADAQSIAREIRSASTGAGESASEEQSPQPSVRPGGSAPREAARSASAEISSSASAGLPPRR